VLAQFRDVYEKMHSALDGMPYAELAISDEVKEQVSPRARATYAYASPASCHQFFTVPFNSSRWS
jgi:hypothetical protein